MYCIVHMKLDTTRELQVSMTLSNPLVTSVEMCQVRVDKKHFLQPYK